MTLHLVRQVHVERENAQTLQARVTELEQKAPQPGATFIAMPTQPATANPFGTVQKNERATGESSRGQLRGRGERDRGRIHRQRPDPAVCTRPGAHARADAGEHGAPAHADARSGVSRGDAGPAEDEPGALESEPRARSRHDRRTARPPVRRAGRAVAARDGEHEPDVVDGRRAAGRGEDAGVPAQSHGAAAHQRGGAQASARRWQVPRMAGIPVDGRRALGSRPRANLTGERRRAARRESREAAAENAARAADEDDAATGSERLPPRRMRMQAGGW